MDAASRVQETADDAATSKDSAARAGYIADPFIAYFCRRTGRRSPLINRGYFARVAAVDLILRRHAAIVKRTGDGRAQVISLGAGFDSTFFRLAADGAAPTTYFEVDFPDVTSRKAAIFRKHRVLQRLIAGATGAEAALEAAADGGGAHGHAHAGAPPAAVDGFAATPNAAGGVDVTGRSGYRLVTADLRDVAAVQAALRGAGVDPSLPTLLLSECVLVYLEPEESCALIAWAAATFARATFVTYEQIRPHDAFGQVMARNLEERGYSLRGLAAFPDVAAQTARYRELGFAAASVADMNDVYYRVLPRADVARAERLELFDEVEEWHLMSAHYCIAIAVNEVAHTPSTAGSAAAAAGAAGGKGARSAAAATAPAALTATPARVIATDMPAPAPKAPRNTSASSAAAATAASGQASQHASQQASQASTGAGGGGASAAPAPIIVGDHAAHASTGGGGGGGASALTPRALAAAVVAQHEGRQAQLLHQHAHGGSGGSGGSSGALVPPHNASQRAVSSFPVAASSARDYSPSPSLSSVGGSFGGAAGGAGGGAGPRGPHSRSLSFAGSDAEMEVASAVEAASGSVVHGMELTPSASPRVGGSAASSAAFRAGNAPPLAPPLAPPRAASSASSVDSASGGGGGGGGALPSAAHSSAVIHTHGGDVHFMTGTRPDGSGLPSVDFSAIAAAEGEMAAARHLREAVGTDVLRASSDEAAAAAAHQQHSHAAAAAVGAPHATPVGAATHARGSAGGGSHAAHAAADGGAPSASASQPVGGAIDASPLTPRLYAPAVEGSRAAMSKPPAARSVYDAAAIDDAAAHHRPVSLLDMLFPLGEWAAETAASPHAARAARAGPVA